MPVFIRSFVLAPVAALLTLAACSAGDPGPTGPAAGPSAAVTAEAAGYTVRDLGTLGGTSSWAFDINNTGGVVGYSGTAAGKTHAFLWRAGRMQDLGALAGGYSEARAINDNDVIVGYSYLANGAMRAVRWQNGQKLNLGTLGGRNSMATGVNDAGLIVGWSETAAGRRHAFLWQNGAMKDLGALGGAGGFSSASGINRAGKVIGWSLKGGQNHAVSWKDGVIKDLGTDGQLSSVAAAINTRGQIAGSLGPWPDAAGEELDYSEPFVYLNEVFTTFGTRQFTSEAHAISSDGTVAGHDAELRDENAFDHAWVKPVGGSAAYLPTLVEGHSQAWGINDFGNIVGIGPTQNGAFAGHAMLWRHQ